MQIERLFFLIALCFAFAQVPSQGGWLLDGLGRPVDSQGNAIPGPYVRLADRLQ